MAGTFCLYFNCLGHIHFGEAILNSHFFSGNLYIGIHTWNLEIYDQIVFEVADLCTSCEGYALQLYLQLEYHEENKESIAQVYFSVSFNTTEEETLLHVWRPRMTYSIRDVSESISRNGWYFPHKYSSYLN